MLLPDGKFRVDSCVYDAASRYYNGGHRDNGQRPCANPRFARLSIASEEASMGDKSPKNKEKRKPKKKA